VNVEPVTQEPVLGEIKISVIAVVFFHIPTEAFKPLELVFVLASTFLYVVVLE
jgi:hypothetical protein